MKLLLLSWNFKNYLFETIRYEQEAIAKIMPEVIFYGPGFTYNHNRLPVIIKEMYGSGKPDAIVCYLSEQELLKAPLSDKIIDRYKVPKTLEMFPLDMNKVEVPKIMIMTDFWHCSSLEWRRIILAHGFNAIFGLCPPFCPKEAFNERFDSDIRDYLYIRPLLSSISLQVFMDYGLPKQYDVMLFGRFMSSIYPLRTHFDKVLKAQNDIKYFNKDNPPYKFYETDDNEYGVPIRSNYARAINQSRIFLTCSTKYKIPVMKIFEGLACKSLLMCDAPSGAEELGLIDGETFIEVNRHNFLEKIRYYLKRPDDMGRISENGYRLVLERHTAEKRALEFKDLVEKMLSQDYVIKTKIKLSYGFINYLRDFKSMCLHFFFILKKIAVLIIRFPARLAKKSF